MSATEAGMPTKNEEEAVAPQYAAGLRIPNMLKASPQHTGEVYKLHIPLIFSVFPRFVQQWMMKMKFLSLLGLLPTWESRFLILLGRFLYKFTDRHNPKAPPKGRPVAVDLADFYQLEEDNLMFEEIATALQERPLGFRHVFVVSTWRKRHFFVAPTREDATTWVHSLTQARQEAIQRSMGHAPRDSCPPSWNQFDNLGNNLVKTKERIEQKLREANLQEFEMTGLGTGGPARTGYYG